MDCGDNDAGALSLVPLDSPSKISAELFFVWFDCDVSGFLRSIFLRTLVLNLSCDMLLGPPNLIGKLLCYICTNPAM